MKNYRNNMCWACLNRTQKYQELPEENVNTPCSRDPNNNMPQQAQSIRSDTDLTCVVPSRPELGSVPLSKNPASWERFYNVDVAQCPSQNTFIACLGLKSPADVNKQQTKCRNTEDKLMSEDPCLETCIDSNYLPFEDSPDDGQKPMIKGYMPCLDFTFPLAHVEEVKHNSGRVIYHPALNYEQFCATETTNGISEKLRKREYTYPVTFRVKTARKFTPYVHHYRFSKSDRVEFMKTLKTGLNKKARRLASQMPLCSVTLTKLPSCEVDEYTRIRTRPPS